MPLVAPLAPDHDAEIAGLAAFFAGTLGFAPNSVLTMLRRPALARAFTELNRAVMDNHGRVTSELKRLVGHVASRVAGCRYCEAHTIRAAERLANSRPDATAGKVWRFRDSDLFTPAEGHTESRVPRRACW
jgi:alkylhydroperoxidase family enzyme